ATAFSLNSRSYRRAYLLCVSSIFGAFFYKAPHGFSRQDQTSPMPLSILIQAQLVGGQLHLTVENTGSWVEPSPATSRGKDNGIGIGISNLRRRLHLIYGNLASLTYENSPQRVLARVTLPIVSAGNRRSNL
ncbi:MAG: hypothetical protein NTZ94_00300, partial [Verrucomicrobia bacterium]|nr:hypothetical protein [Verrucomicrobiota bacterium]